MEYLRRRIPEIRLAKKFSGDHSPIVDENNTCRLGYGTLWAAYMCFFMKHVFCIKFLYVCLIFVVVLSKLVRNSTSVAKSVHTERSN